jgi:hypothetical protein
MDQLPPLPLCLLASALRGASRRHPTDAPTALAAVRPAGKNQATRLGSARNDGPESFPPLFLWGRALLPVLVPGLAGLFLCTASGHTRRCRRQPTGETTAGELPRTAAHQHQRETAGLPETLAEGPGCCPCAGGALPRRLSPGVSHTEVDRKRYPDNLCEPPLVWSNFFKI